MLKKVALGIILATGLASHVSAEDQSNLYIGAQYNVHSLEAEGETENLGSIGALAGYLFTPYFAIEVRANLGVKDYSETYLGETVKIEINNSLSAFFKASYPVNEQFSVYGLAGFNNTKYKATLSDAYDSYSGTETESGFAYGIGAEFAVNANWSFGVEYVVLPELTNELDVNNVTFLAKYRF